MAFKDVKEKFDGVKLSELEVGKSVEGYLLDFVEGTYGTNLKMEIEDKPYLVMSAGNIKYLIKDKKLKLGLNTRITRLEDQKKKGPKGAFTSSNFRVEQDPDDVKEGISSSPVTKTPTETSFKDKIQSMKG